MQTSESTRQHDRPQGAETGADSTMPAVVQDRYGDPDVLRFERIAKPEIGPDEVLVRVLAAGVDRGVWHLVSGLPYPLRLAGYGMRKPKNPVPGMDLAGVVEAVGSEVDGLRIGDEVFGIGIGAFAGYARAEAEKLTLKPAGLSFEQAAAVPISALAALQAVRDQARTAEGQSVLVIGASGGVGGYAVQIAKALGAEVTGVASTGKLDLVRSLGADHVVDYRREQLTDRGRSYGVIIDTGGNRPLAELRGLLEPRGTLVIVGGEGGGRVLGGTDRQLRAMALSPFISQKLGTFISSENGEDLRALKELVETGQLKPVVDRSFPLSEVPAAIRYLREGRARGKIVIDVAST